MLQNAYFDYFLAKIGADTAENEQHFAEILPKNGNYPAGPAGLGEGEVLRRAELEDGPRGHLLRRAEDEGYLPPRGSPS